MNIRNISSNQIVVWSALLLGLIVAVFVGSAVGASDMRVVAGLIAVVPVVIAFVKLKTNIWVLLPVGWYLTGRLPWLPLPFTVKDICFATVIFFFTLFFATRALPWRRKIGTLEHLIYINLAYLATVFVRNPVGFWAIQSSMVGGRPYFEIALALGAFLILSRIHITDLIAKIFPLFFVIPAWCLGLLDVIGRLSPQLGSAMNSIYSGVGSRGVSSALQEEAKIGETRMVGLQNAGASSVVALCAKYNPVTLMNPLYPLRVIFMAAAFAAIFLSGYRSVLLFGMMAFVLSAILRRQLRDLWSVAAMLLLVVTLLISLQGSALQLPKTMQRALSWLPGDWDQEAVMDAEDSSRWRFEMWEWAWNDERILRDRIWGQGFGLSIDDMNIIAQSMMYTGGPGFIGGSNREGTMLVGTFHSGPLSTIKFIGIVGLVLYFALMCYMAFAAWNLCVSARYTKAFSLSLFVSIPIIYEPFNFMAVFGALEASYPQTLFWAGLLNMTQAYVDRLKSASKAVNEFVRQMPNT